MRVAFANNYGDAPVKKRNRGALSVLDVDYSDPIGRLPGGAEYNWDQKWFNAAEQNPAILPFTIKQSESYYKLLPDLSRGHLVPDGYPALYGGLLLQQNTLPRIVALTPGQEHATTLSVVKTAVKGIPALPHMTAAEFMSDRGTVVYERNAKGQPITWFSRKYMVALSYQPHVLFNNLYVNKKIFLDPSSQYAESNFQAWQSDTYLHSILVFAVVVVAACFGAYEIGTALGTGTAATAGGTTTLAPTVITTTAPTAGGVSTIATTANFTATSLGTVSVGAGAAGAAGLSAGGLTAAADVAAGLGKAAAVVATVKGALAQKKAAAAVAYQQSVAAAGTPAVSKSLVPAAAVFGAAAVGLLLLFGLGMAN